ncbi:MAG: hypothetical protein ACR2KE_03760 [Candidatus Nanopelagicales bacterium]
MGWTWIYTDAHGAPVAEVPAMAALEPFPTQADAETWLGESWRELLDSGVDAVVLWEDERVAYGPMSLHPPS